MKDTPTSQPNTDELTSSQSESATDQAILKSTIAQQHNDENKNIILLDDDDNNQNILSTQNNENHNRTLSQTQSTPKNYINNDSSPAKTIMNDSDSNEMTTSQTETPLPDWIALNESVLIRPYNLSGVIGFIGATHFSVNFPIVSTVSIQHKGKFPRNNDVNFC